MSLVERLRALRDDMRHNADEVATLDLAIEALTVSPRMVEAGARALFEESQELDQENDWDDPLPDEWRDAWREAARACITDALESGGIGEGSR